MGPAPSVLVAPFSQGSAGPGEPPWGAMQWDRVSPGCTSARGFFILQRACLYWSLLVKLLCCGQPALGL